MADEVMLDPELFISMVEERPVLWDKNIKLYKNRQATQLAWDEIIMTLNPALASESEHAKQGYENTLRKKWRYFRDQYSVELAKIPAGMEGKYKPKWPYFEALQFLRDVVPRRSLPKRLRRSPSTSDHNEDDDNPHISFQIEEESYDPLEEDEKPLRKKARTSNVLHYARKQETEETSDADEHLFFFKSLLPHMRRIPCHHILSFRSRIQEIVEEYAYGQGNQSGC